MCIALIIAVVVIFAWIVIILDQQYRDCKKLIQEFDERLKDLEDE